MPSFFSKRKSKYKKEGAASGIIPSSSSQQPTTTTSANANSSAASTASNKPTSNSRLSKTNGGKQQDQLVKLVFHCQLAHGSPTGLISGFNSVKELYKKIADCFEIDAATILYCTLNTHKIEMNKLLGGQIGLDDFIFAHVKGQTKEIDIIKSEPTLGLTIADNGAGYCFIKRIKEGSVTDKLKTLIKAGDHIEKINGKSLVGTRHFEVAKILKDIPVGSTFKMRLVEPNGFGFHIEPANRNRGKAGDVKNGTKTLRFKADGRASVEEVDDTMVKAIDRINGLLETYMGINDSDLAQQIWDLAQNKNNPSDFATAIDESEIGTFNFTDEFIFDLWAAIGDIKAGRVRGQEQEQDYENERL